MKKVAIVVGHDSKEPGAKALLPIGMNEYMFNVGLSRSITDWFDRLVDQGLSAHVFFRDKLGIEKTYEELKLWGPDYCIELHFNSHSDKSIRGTETLCVEHNKDFAQAIQAAICKAFGRSPKTDRGIKVLKEGDRGYHSVSALKCPSCLIEPFFGSNQEDCTLADDRKESLAMSIVEAVRNFDKTKEVALG